MNHEGSARRSAFHTAENELTRYATSQGLRDYAERVADVLAPSLVVAIGPNLTDPDHEPRLTGLSQTVRDALGASWRDVHAVSRATWELGLLETVRDVDTSYRQQREEQRVLADYERMVSPPPASPPAPVAVELPAMADRSPSVQPSEPERAVPLLNVPVLPSISAWSLSAEQAAAAAVPNWPRVMSFEASALAQASRVWRDPAEVLGQIRSEIAADPGRLNDVLKAVAREPQSYGDLLGGRTVFLQPDAERKEALTHIPLVSSTVSQLVHAEQRSVAFLTQQERDWRAHMATPAPTLSPEALVVLSTLSAAHDLKQTDREAGHHMAASTLSNPKALEEIKSWRQDAEKRLSVPDALERLPDMTPEKREEVRAIVATVDQAVKTADMSQSVEQSREREREAAKNPDRDLGMEM